MILELILVSLVVLCALVILICRWLLPELGRRIPEPWYLDYSRSFLPVLFIVLVLRGFIAEPFRIPSGSMLPTLEVGDFILVNKYQYGLRLPLTYDKVVEIGTPQRGDIMVFRYPGDNKTNYIKRVIGVPGDEIVYRNKQLYINGKLVRRADDGEYLPTALQNQAQRSHDRFTMTVPGSDDEGDVSHSILIDNMKRAKISNRWTVPEGRYFMLGDNRDHSEDSRFWRFVPEENIVGKAFFIWFHFNGRAAGDLSWWQRIDWSRIGTTL